MRTPELNLMEAIKLWENLNQSQFLPEILPCAFRQRGILRTKAEFAEEGCRFWRLFSQAPNAFPFSRI